jgi:hypothetical protein
MRRPRWLAGPLALSLPALMLCATLAPAPAPAQDDTGGSPFLSAPAVPSQSFDPAQVEPEVTITETDTEVIYEYRVKGEVYMVRVDPIVGPSYYLMDLDGDGVLDPVDQRPDNLAVPQWLLFSW